MALPVGRPTPARAIEIAERRKEALNLRIMGLSYTEIAEQLEVSRPTAIRDIQTVLAELRQETLKEAEDLRNIELRRLELATAAIMPKVAAGDMQAIAALIRLSERRCKLMGLDKQIEQMEHDVRVRVVREAMDASGVIDAEATVVERGDNQTAETSPGAAEDNAGGEEAQPGDVRQEVREDADR